jgi:hypothetical protein
MTKDPFALDLGFPCWPQFIHTFCLAMINLLFLVNIVLY